MSADEFKDKAAEASIKGSDYIKVTLAEKIKNIPKKTPEETKNWLCNIINRLLSDWIPAIAPALFGEVELIELCYRAREVFWQEKGIVNVTVPVTIVGDIHGQFVDLKAIFLHNGCPPHEKYVFLGDYVDRGPFSIECITLLLALKILYPNIVTLLRGNHESQPVNMHYGFFEECKARYSITLYEAFQQVFNCLPFCANVEGKILCMHGGISKKMNNLKHLEAIEIPCEIAEMGVLADITWADPTNDKSRPFFIESPRGAGYIFGPQALNNFLDMHKFNLIIRGHQVVNYGFEVFEDERLITIFSAPTYTGTHNNYGAIMHVNAKFEIYFTVFKDKLIESKKNDKDKDKAKGVTTNKKNAKVG